MLTVGHPIQPKMQFLLLKFRSLAIGNCVYSSLSLLLIGYNYLVEVLRCLTSIELYLNPDYYGRHCCFDVAFNSQILNCKGFEWSSFMCLLVLSSVLKGHILSYYHDVGDVNHKHSFNCNITPRTNILSKSALEYCFCRNKTFGTFIKSAKF